MRITWRARNKGLPLNGELDSAANRRQENADRVPRLQAKFGSRPATHRYVYRLRSGRLGGISER
jgi:hypothetical protein